MTPERWREGRPFHPVPECSIERFFGRGYEQLYRNLLLSEGETRREAAFLLKRLAPAAGQRWLDVPCGFGRHLVQLARRRPGLRLIGGDLNRDYLRGADLSRAAEVLCCDMRRLPLADRSVDVVVNMLNSFGYYPPLRVRRPDDRAVLREWARVLRPAGHLVMDLPNRRPLIELVRRQSRIRYCGGPYAGSEQFRWDSATQCMFNRTVWQWPGGREEASYRLRLYTPTQMRRMLARAGFRVETMLGDFDESPFHPRRSDRMIVIARNRGSEAR